MGIQINGQTDRISAVDGSFGIQDLAELNVSGIVTAASANFTGNVSIGGTLTYQDVTNIDSVGVITARAGVKVPDSQKIFAGTGDDLQIYHDGSNSWISDEGTGALNLRSVDGSIQLLGKSNNEAMGVFVPDGAVELYYDNSKKFETTSGGVEVSSGNLTMQSNGRIFVGNGGNAVNPMFANVSDTNTGIAFPSADTMLFATGGSERLRITSSGIIKCGTSSTLKAEINSAIGGHQFISQCSDNNNGFEIYQQHGSTTTRNTFAVYANTGGGGAQELQFSIRGDGCVTKPKSPSFSANLSSGNLNAATHNNVIIFNNEHFDNGNNYNTSNGRFTAPVDGDYYFGIQIYAGFGSGAVRVLHAKFRKNGNDVAAADMFGGTNDDGGTSFHPTGCGHMLISLSANDYIDFHSGTFSGTGSGHRTIYAASGTRFFGYLVG